MRFKDWIAFLLLGFIWGSSFLWIKLALREISPLALVSFRLLFGIIGLGILLLISKPKLPTNFRIYIILFLIGIIGNALPYVLITWGEQYIDSSVAAILNSTTPLFTMVIAHLFLSDDKMNLKRVVSLVIGFIGVIILVLRDLDFNDLSSSMVLFTILGEVAVLLASLCYSTSSVFARGTTKGLSPSVVGFFPLLGADLIMWTITPIFNHQPIFPNLPLTWIALLWLGFIGIGVASILYYFLIHSVGPTRTTMVTYIFPVVGLLLGIIFLKEKLDLHLLLGSILIISSIIIVNQKSNLVQHQNNE
jgi:drug/metabolite transporter (DMT)-like permease